MNNMNGVKRSVFEYKAIFRPNNQLLWVAQAPLLLMKGVSAWYNNLLESTTTAAHTCILVYVSGALIVPKPNIALQSCSCCTAVFLSPSRDYMHSGVVAECRKQHCVWGWCGVVSIEVFFRVLRARNVPGYEQVFHVRSRIPESLKLKPGTTTGVLLRHHLVDDTSAHNMSISFSIFSPLYSG